VYAAKVVAIASLQQEKYRLKLHGEIITHGLMKHPRIVQFYSCFEDDNNVYLILELCENKVMTKRSQQEEDVDSPFYVRPWWK
jgi:serine/threonine protein kinase